MEPISMTTQFLYLFDPLCGWCYGASAGIATLAAHPGVMVEALPTGLFAGQGARALGGAMHDHILASDRQIAALSGAEFSALYRERIVGGGSFLLDSGPATLALTAVAQSAPDRELATLGLIQRARYVDGRDVTDTAVLIAVLEGAGLDVAARALADPTPALDEANRQRLDRAQAAMRRFGISGVPALLRDDGGRLTQVDTAALYQDPLSLVRHHSVA